VVEAASGLTTTHILLDCGFSAKEIERRLARLGLRLEQLGAIVITHEHSDHIGSALTLARRCALPIYMSWGTACAVGADTADIDLRVLWGGEQAAFGDLAFLPYTVPHDAREPLQFVFTDGVRRLGVLTDAGDFTPHIGAALNGCDALVLECNHDAAMLASSRYPQSLKARIAGQYGHLSNEVAARILATLEHHRLKHVVAAHLSQQNNRPELAQQALAGVLGTPADAVRVASQQGGIDWLDLAGA